MGLVTRPTKTGGFTTYTEEVANGNTTILASEVDADLNAIITGGVNNIETANINANGLDTAAIADNAITTDKIANDAVTIDKIADDSVDTAQIVDEAVTTDKIAVNATINAFQGATVNTGLSFSTVETTIVTLPSITTRGGIPEVVGSWGLTLVLNDIASSETVTLRVKRDAVTVYTIITTVSGTAAGSEIIRVPVPPPYWFDAFLVGSPGSYVYTITGQTSNASVGLTTDGASAGAFFVKELA